MTCSATYAITQDDLDTGSVTNTAQGHGFSGTSPVNSNQDDETVTAVQASALTLLKGATPTTYDEAGDVINYSYILTNTGNVTLEGPFTVEDDRATVTCPATPTRLAPGESTVCTASYEITQDDLDAGSVTNTAQAHGSFDTTLVDSNLDGETVDAIQNPALTLDKRASPVAYDEVGDVIRYDYELTNSGNVTLGGPFTVDDDRSTDEACPAAPSSLAPGQGIICTASYTITQGDLDAGSVTNTAQGHGSFGENPVDSNDDSETVNAGQAAALLLQKNASPAAYDEGGDVISYSYLLTNIGTVTLDGPFTVDDDRATVTCTQPDDGQLSPEETMACTATYVITQDDLDVGSVTNTAQAHGTFGASPVHSNQDSATVNASQATALTLRKAATPTTCDQVGDVISYSYVLTNSGNVTLDGPFTVTDDRTTNEACPATPASLAPGESIVCTASYHITQADLDAGSAINIAQGHGFFGTTPVDSNYDAETVTAVQTSVLTLLKSGRPTTYDEVGDVINYSYVLTNTGNVTLDGPFTVTDDRATVTCPATPASLAPSQSLVCTASYEITQDDLDAGSVANIAQGRGYFGTTPVDSNRDSETVTVQSVSHRVYLPLILR
jgi:hypothetical protein